VRNPSSVLFRCDASPEIGLGHIVRCVALADELVRTHGVSVGFAMRESSIGCEIVKRRSYPILRPPSGAAFDYEAWLSDSMRQSKAQVLVADVRDDLPQSVLEALAGRGAVIAVLDDVSERRLAADIAFYPPVPQVQRANWATFRGRLCVGWEWIVLRSQFAEPLQARRNSTRRLLIAMGGSDPAGLTLKAVRAVDVLDEDFECVVVLGSGFGHRQSMQDLLGNTRRRFSMREDVREMSATMAQADLALCSFGMTAYELAAMGVPAVYVCLTADHAESASALVDAGMGVSVGVNDENTETRLRAAVDRLLVDKNARARMSMRARELVDGRGASRVAALLVSTVTARN
jgi:spore coat polysaccharide biosynthesis predicted glycosyltransferase SpsG